jgi:CO dehydrogenase nickel-insertion accessory protein CooC1
MADFEFLGFLDYDPRIVEADLSGKAPYVDNPQFLKGMEEIVKKIDPSV